MLGIFKQLDKLLRGEATRLPDLRQGSINVRIFGMAVVTIILGIVSGACMGTFSAFRPAPSGTAGAERLAQLTNYQQLIASAVKVPALFFLTLLVTFPSLYVFNALVGSRLRFLSVLRLLLAALAVNVAVLASLGPIVAFFSICTTSYPFMVLLNVGLFAVSGVLGLAFLLQTLHRLTVAMEWDAEEVVPTTSSPQPTVEGGARSEPMEADIVMPQPRGSAPSSKPGPLEWLEGYALRRHVKKVFACWMVLFSLVGAQMGWVLRPFIGDPHMPFTWLRPRESNFFEAVLRSLRQLFP